MKNGIKKALTYAAASIFLLTASVPSQAQDVQIRKHKSSRLVYVIKGSLGRVKGNLWNGADRAYYLTGKKGSLILDYANKATAMEHLCTVIETYPRMECKDTFYMDECTWTRRKNGYSVKNEMLGTDAVLGIDDIENCIEALKSYQN